MRKLYWILGITLSLILLLGIIRAVLPREIDDVNPLISCEPNLIKKSDILWIIPMYKNESIANNSIWCNSLLSLNKNLGMHGVYHTYHEFEQNKDEIYIRNGMNAFEQCFRKEPDSFKAPMLAINRENRLLIEMQGMRVKGRVNQILHKVYHCNDEGQFPNWLIDLY